MDFLNNTAGNETDWSAYAQDASLAQDENIADTEETTESREENGGIIYLDRAQIASFTNRLSGRTAEGSSKAVLSYQTYAMEEPEDSPDKERIYTVNKACVELSTDPKNPGFYILDIIFRSYDEPELKMLWGRLQKFKRNLMSDGEKTWLFYFNILENASVTSQTLERDTLLTCNAFNPLLFYITREVPNMLTKDIETEDGELQGGNIIRMLLSEKLVTFQVSSDIDTSQIKGEVLREIEDSRYLDASEDSSEM